MDGPWVYGGLVSNVWSVAGSGASDINLLTLQPFINYNLPGGGYFTSSPDISANLRSRQQRAVDRATRLGLWEDLQARQHTGERADQPLSQCETAY